MTVLADKTIAALMIGFTHHVDIGKETDATISYLDHTRAKMVLPGNVTMHGVWHMLPDGYHVAWHDGPAGKWQITSAPGTLTYLDPTGKAAGTVTLIAPARE